ncbi:hypothetical protein BJV77DRAFT_1071939 [Russula vinacea]|nr:hypothetical protein BJV77DRAFT_1071939 [Russula vinacea]
MYNFGNCQHALAAHPSLLDFNTPLHQNIMETLFSIASRVEAAIKSYVGVQQDTNKKEWWAKFQSEFEESVITFYRIRQKNGGNPTNPPALHPTLAALAIVLRKNQDFGMITRSHPDLKDHKYFNPDVDFSKTSLTCCRQGKNAGGRTSLKNPEEGQNHPQPLHVSLPLRMSLPFRTPLPLYTYLPLHTPLSLCIPLPLPLALLLAPALPVTLVLRSLWLWLSPPAHAASDTHLPLCKRSEEPMEQDAEVGVEGFVEEEKDELEEEQPALPPAKPIRCRGLTPSPSGLTPSPSTLIPPLGHLTLDNTSFPADTAADVAEMQDGSDVESAEPAPVARPSKCHSTRAPKPTVSAHAHAVAFTLHQAHSHGDESQASGGGRSTAPSCHDLDERLGKIETWMWDVERRLRDKSI